MTREPLSLPQWSPPEHGAEDDVCITCGDVAVPLTVVEVDGGDARCRADDGGEEIVAIELVGDVSPGDRVLVHAKVAIERLTDGDHGRTDAVR